MLIVDKSLCNKVISNEHYFILCLEMKDIQFLLESQGYNNFHVTDQFFPTIWGGSSLLDMFLYVVKWTLSNPNFQQWDYIFNFSESDFPVLSLAELEAILAT